MSENLPDGVFVRPSFLPPPEMLAVLGAVHRLSSCWAPSESLKLLGRGRTDQVSAADPLVQRSLDQIRGVLAPAALDWARACGFPLGAAPHLQLFPVRMIGDAKTPAFQEPHHDSHHSQPRPPVCTNVFYARVQGVIGGGLAVTPKGEPDAEPFVIQPVVNSIATFDGDRVHWVQPLYGGERLSIVVNFY